MNKKLRILCVCQKGNVRSVGIARRLKDKRHYRNVIAIGAENTEEATLAMLCDWAELILLAEPSLGSLLPRGTEKVVDEFTIGPDVYNNPIHTELQSIIGEQLNGVGLK